MRWGATLRATAAFFVLVALHYTLRPLLGWRAPMDFLLIAVLLASVRVRPGVAALLGLVVGLAADALAPTSFGSGALAMTVVAYGASWLKAVFFADNVFLHGFFFFLGKWTFDAVYLISERKTVGVELVTQLLLWSPLAAAVTALAGVVLLVMLRPLLERRAA